MENQKNVEESEELNFLEKMESNEWGSRKFKICRKGENSKNIEGRN